MEVDIYTSSLRALARSVKAGEPPNEGVIDHAFRFAARAAIAAEPQSPGAAWTPELEELGNALAEAGAIRGWPWTPHKMQVIDLLKAVP